MKNIFIKSLCKVCEERLLDEKWLIAPTLRVGNQWVEAAARAGRPAVNVRVQTLKGMALDLASSRMASEGVTLLSSAQGEILVDLIWNGLRDAEKGYIGVQRRTFALSKTIFATINALRLADIDPAVMKPGKFEVGEKGKELAAVSREYIKALKGENLIDYADALRWAAAELRNNPDAMPRNAIVLISGDADFTALEEALLASIPEEKLKRLATDPPGNFPQGVEMNFFPAIGEINEVREALRRCVAEKISFDKVEILHTDTDTYVPLIYEIIIGRHETSKPEDAEKTVGDEQKNIIEKHDPPVTFAEGIPVRYSRPGRALKAWLEWMNAGYPQTILSRMLQDGLLEVAGNDEEEISYVRLADALRSVSIYHGRERYIGKIDEKISALQNRVERLKKESEENDRVSLENVKTQLRALGIIRDFVRELLDSTPEPGDGNREVLRKTIHFIENFTRKNSELDNYSRDALAKEIKNLLSWIESDRGVLSLDVRDWLGGLARDTRVLGSGPRPGRIHVANIHSGGHSGRPYTFILGLDDSRFPGAAPQNPLLLDSERKNISIILKTSVEQLQSRVDGFALLLARLRGSVTLSFSRRDLRDDREAFPSPVLLSLFRAAYGKSEADLEDFYSSLPPPASFAPSSPERCLDESEWWLWRLCGDEVENARDIIHHRFPHLKRGNRAAEQRLGAEFTVYDGRVERAGRDNDPTRTDGPAMSASRLETLGRCPTAYFFKYILKLEPPDEAAVDPSVWLDPLASGSLLHEVFERFMRIMIDENRTPSPKDWDSLKKILDRRVDAYKNDFPPPSENSFKRQYNVLLEAARTFLAEEEIHCRAGRPAYLETSIGLRADSPSELDSPDPVEIELPNGKKIRARGIIDRVDLTGDNPPAYSIWDYKTGGTFSYSVFEPFQQGRRIQHYLYLLLVRARLKEISPKAAIALFGFFFPGVKGRGERMSWTPEQLSGGGHVLQKLCETAAAGAFIHSDDPGDCFFCEFSPICGDTEAISSSAKMKLENDENKILKPFSELREYQV